MVAKTRIFVVDDSALVRQFMAEVILQLERLGKEDISSMGIQA